MYYIKYVVVLLISIFIFSVYIDAYTEYSVGDPVVYNGVDYYVIKNSGAKEASLTLLKATPLTTSEVNEYGAGHVNMYTSDPSYYQTAYDDNGYGGMAYYSSATCGWNGNNWMYSGCTTNYAASEIKYVVDAWTVAKTNVSDLTTDSTGYKARLLTIDDLIDNLGYSWQQTSEGNPTITENVPLFMMPVNIFGYWTMSQHLEDERNVWHMFTNGTIHSYDVQYDATVRPVIILKKTALGDIEENINDNDNQKEEKTEDSVNDKDSINEDVSVIVSVPNTLQKISIVLIMIGITFLSISIVILVKKRK